MSLDRYLEGSELRWFAAGSHVATLPDGSRVELPAGTVLREGTIKPTPADACSRAKLVNCGDFGVECHDPECPLAVGGWHGTTLTLADLTERAGLPREMAPSVLRVAGKPVAEVTSITFDRTVRAENVPPGMLEDGAIFATVGPEGAIVPAEPDPWLRGLTITTANAIRSSIDRGLPAKAGIAAVIAAFQAGVDMAIDPLLPKP